MIDTIRSKFKPNRPTAAAAAATAAPTAAAKNATHIRETYERIHTNTEPILSFCLRESRKLHRSHSSVAVRRQTLPDHFASILCDINTYIFLIVFANLSPVKAGQNYFAWIRNIRSRLVKLCVCFWFVICVLRIGGLHFVCVCVCVVELHLVEAAACIKRLVDILCGLFRTLAAFKILRFAGDWQYLGEKW